jgi:hypothetical protein
VLSAEDLASIDVFGDGILEEYHDGFDGAKASGEHDRVGLSLYLVLLQTDP